MEELILGLRGGKVSGPSGQGLTKRPSHSVIQKKGAVPAGLLTRVLRGSPKSLRAREPLRRRPEEKGVESIRRRTKKPLATPAETACRNVARQGFSPVEKKDHEGEKANARVVKRKLLPSNLLDTNIGKKGRQY